MPRSSLTRYDTPNNETRSSGSSSGIRTDPSGCSSRIRLSMSISSWVTSASRVVLRALNPGRPGASPMGSIAVDSGVKLEAIETTATRPFGVSRYRPARAADRVSPAPACTIPASSRNRLVDRMPSMPQSVVWLFARATMSNPRSARSWVISGTPISHAPPYSACG